MATLYYNQRSIVDKTKKVSIYVQCGYEVDDVVDIINRKNAALTEQEKAWDKQYDYTELDLTKEEFDKFY